jgi:hypothetical protein
VPSIVRFSSRILRDDPQNCRRQGLEHHQVAWVTRDATDVRLRTPAGEFAEEPNGAISFCAASGRAVSIVAVGPGGEATDQLTL